MRGCAFWPVHRMRFLLFALAVVQAIMATRVLARLVGTSRGRRIRRHEASPATGERVTILVPVLDEADRLRPCLEGLIRQGAEVAEILVLDGGSRDGTQEIVLAFAERDA